MAQTHLDPASAQYRSLLAPRERLPRGQKIESLVDRAKRGDVPPCMCPGNPPRIARELHAAECPWATQS
ncbi:MAG: hypothetical protein JWO85_240 [Candidatus Eremiobacteraeota bacterium]|nr:hypothetical protein [Candidatus Eremiobacteraeota bacterium]